MKTIALSLVIALSSLACRGPEAAAEVTPQQELFAAFRQALEGDMDATKDDLEQARTAMDARGGDDLQFNVRWQSVRRQLEALEREIAQMDAVEKPKLEKMIQDIARLREDASEMRAGATASVR